MLTHVDQAETIGNHPYSVTQEMFSNLHVSLATDHFQVSRHLTIKALFSHFSTVVFSSMTSLQREEFFELVATAQARRLDDQRAQLERAQPPKPKARSFRGSIKQLSFVKKPAPVPVPKDDLYDMILTTQVSNKATSAWFSDSHQTHICKIAVSCQLQWRII